MISMKEAQTYAEFLDLIKKRAPCFVTVDLSSLASSLEALMDLGLERPPNDWSGLRGICPICSSWVPGYTLGMVTTIGDAPYHVKREKVTFTNYGDISHLLDNHCIKSDCSSRLIQLIWQGDQSIKEQLTKHLQRIQTDPENQGHDSLLRVVSGMQEYNVLSFAQDVIFSAELNHPTRATMVGYSAAGNIRFLDPSRFPKIAVWVSVIPFLPFSENALRIAFSGGYASYFNRLLPNSRYDEGDITVAHWISFGSGPNCIVTLAMLSEKDSLGTARAFRIRPGQISADTVGRD